MPKIVDMKTFKAYAPAMDAEIKAVFEKYGLEWGKRKASMSETDIRYTVTVGYSTADGKSAALREWNMYAHLFGFKKEDFGREFWSNGKRYRISGIHPAKHKRPIGVTRLLDNKVLICEPEIVQKALAA